MIHEVEISPEVVRLAQFRTRAVGTALASELARNVVEESILNQDPEQGLLLEEDQCYCQNDALVAAFAVNDIVVNGHRFDVRPLDEDGRIVLPRLLVGTRYFGAGTLAVRMNGNLKGHVASFIPASQWNEIDKSASSEQHSLSVKVEERLSLDLSAIVNSLEPAPATMSKNARSCSAPTPAQLVTLVADSSELSAQQRREIVDGALANPDCWTSVRAAAEKWSNVAVRRVLHDSANWNVRLQRLTALLAEKFRKLSAEDIRKTIETLAETQGAQTDLPTFRKALLSTLSRQELSHQLGGAALKKATEVVDAILSGQAVVDAVKTISRNAVAIDIAEKIKKQRDKMTNFADATAQELSGAFQQLALQPVYATHSQDPQAGVEAINEALKLIDAAELAENLKSIENELANV